jgi:hypothetical protein
MSLEDEITRRALVHSAKTIAQVEAERDAAVAALERVKALCSDPWIARNHGELARFQEGVSRRGGVRYGEFVGVADIRAALKEPS